MLAKVAFNSGIDKFTGTFDHGESLKIGSIFSGPDMISRAFHILEEYTGDRSGNGPHVDIVFCSEKAEKKREWLNDVSSPTHMFKNVECLADVRSKDARLGSRLPLPVPTPLTESRPGVLKTAVKFNQRENMA